MPQKTFLLTLCLVCFAFSGSLLSQQQLGENGTLLFEVREWTDKSGGFSVRAKLVEIDNREVVLQKTDGSTVRVPLERLSLADQAYCVTLKKRIDGELEQLLDEGLQNDLVKSQEIVERLLMSVEKFKNSQLSILTSNDSLARKSERLDELLESFSSDLSKLSRRQIVCHAEVLDLEYTDERNKKRYGVDLKILDMPGIRNGIFRLNGAGDEKLTKTFVPGAIVKLRGSLVKTKSTFEAIPLAKFNKKPDTTTDVEVASSRNVSAQTVTIPYFVSSINLLSKEDAAVLKLK